MAKLEVTKSGLAEKLLPAILVVLVALSIGVGALWQKVENIGKGSQALGAATTQPQATTQPKIDIAQIKDLFSKDLIKLGGDDKKVTFVEVGDPSCPYCHIAGGRNGELNKSAGFALTADGGTYIAPVPEMEKLVKDGKASFIYIYYPGHGNGEMAMKALYCANEKGKFWETNDILMSQKGYEIQNGVDVKNQPITGIIVKNDKTKSKELANFLKEAVDPTFMKECLDSGKYDGRLAADMTIASSLNISGTPGFFVNDNTFPGAYSWNDMKSIVDSAL